MHGSLMPYQYWFVCPLPGILPIKTLLMTNKHTHAHTHNVCMHACSTNTHTEKSYNRTIVISSSSDHNLSSSPRWSDCRHFECIGCAGDQCRDFDAIGTGISVSTVFKCDKIIFRAYPLYFTWIWDLMMGSIQGSIYYYDRLNDQRCVINLRKIFQWLLKVEVGNSTWEWC